MESLSIACPPGSSELGVHRFEVQGAGFRSGGGDPCLAEGGAGGSIFWGTIRSLPRLTALEKDDFRARFHDGNEMDSVGDVDDRGSPPVTGLSSSPP